MTLVYLMISPLAFALGSAEREYVTLTANQGSYTPSESMELPPWVHSQRVSGSWPPQSWLHQAVDKEWDYLLDDTPPGQLICARRGKVLIIASGYVSCRPVSSDLETETKGKCSTPW
jgi:hypothetical protein